MITSYRDSWKLAPFIALGLMLVRDLAPVSDSLDGILTGVANVILLVFFGTYFWQERRARRAGRSDSAVISSRNQT
jgi:hypothetical protein